MLRPLRGLEFPGIAVLLLVVSTLFFPPSIEGQLVVDQLELFLTEVEGTASGTFSVTNVTEAPVTGQIALQDWRREESGTNLFLDPGSVSGSCHPRVQVFPAFLLLAPQETQIVEVTYEGPTLTTSCWTSVRVGTAPTPASNSGGVQINMEIHQFVKVYVEPPSGWGDVELLDADVVPFEEDPRRGPEPVSEYDVLAVARNPGTTQVWVSGVIEYRTLENTVIHRSEFSDAPILPGAVRRMRVALPDLPTGRYVALVLLDGGGSERAAAQIDLEIGP